MLNAVLRAVHLAWAAFVALAPALTSDRSVLLAHAVMVPALWLHWVTNEDTCALTELEKWARGVDDDSSFVHSVVSPVFRLSEPTLRRVSWAVSVAAWAWTMAQLTTRSR